MVASYLMDSTYDWTEYRVFSQIPSGLSIDPYDSRTFERAHGLIDVCVENGNTYIKSA